LYIYAIWSLKLQMNM